MKDVWNFDNKIRETLDLSSFFNREKFSRSSRSYLVVTCDVNMLQIASKVQYVTNCFKSSICYKWLQMFLLQQKVTHSRSYLVVTCDVNILQMASRSYLNSDRLKKIQTWIIFRVDKKLRNHFHVFTYILPD